MKFKNAKDVGNGAAFSEEEQFEITERGLDPDELAELRAMRVQVAAIIDADGPQDSTGTCSIDVGAGYNLSGDEFLNANPDITQIDSDDSGTDDLVSATKDTDEVGQLYSTSFNAVIPYDDDANSNGAGPALPNETETMNYAAMFGSGPVVDAADDFTTRIRLGLTNAVQTVGVKTTYSLYYAVEAQEGGRTRFGR